MIHSEEPVIKGYDPRIVGRILRYVKPYWVLVTFSMLFILISTGGQLLLPVVIQRAVDENLRPAWLAGDPERHEEVLAFDPRLDGEYRQIGSRMYYPESMAGPWFRSETGNVDLFFLLPLDQADIGAEERSELENLPAVEIADGVLAIPEALFRNLDDSLKTSLRQADIQGIGDKALFYLGILVAVLIASFLQIFLMALAGQNVMKDLRMDLYSRTMNQNLKFLQDQQVGKLVTRVSSDVETINELFTDVLSAIISDVVMMAGVMVTLFVLNPRLGLYSLVILPPVLILMVIFRRRARDAYRQVRKWVSSVNAYISEHLSGVALVQAFVREPQVDSEFRFRNKKLYQANVGELYVFTIFRPVVDLLATASVAMIMYFGAATMLRGLVSLGVLIAFINLIQRFYRPVQDMAEKFTLIQSAMAGSERVFALLDEDHQEERRGTREFLREDVRGALRFENVRFSYKTDEEVLRGISFSCEPGERIALVGYTGSGKTTIANVLSRLWEYDDGLISLDGINIKDIPLDSLRSIIQPIQQDLSLFHMSVRDNLLLGREYGDEDIYRILDQVEAGDFIRALPEGLDTIVAENSDNFSTGQLQLLSFARLLIQDPRIVIMDEATANIDTDTESKIQHAMERIMQGRTSIVIAHRLSTIKDADRILVLNKGQVEESGTHEELMSREGLYRTLQEIQFSRLGG
jgi:ATP-binding cassette subfamily B multidrug efflux pump